MKNSKDLCFNNFKVPIEGIEVPSTFTFPFYYEPHPLSVIASEQLQQELTNTTNWHHNFGIEESDQVNSGKMFGVLVVQKPNGELGFLKGFSGKLANTDCPTGYVPHIYDLLPGNNFFEVGMQKINKITARIQLLSQHPDFEKAKIQLAKLKQNGLQDIESERTRLNKEKAQRLILRNSQSKILSTTEYETLLKTLAEESVRKKFYFKHLNLHWKEKIQQEEQITKDFYQEYEDLKLARKQGSNDLQQEIFEHYTFLNAHGYSQNLKEIFNKLGIHLPPAGAGDCAAPKLIQHAYKMNYKPICMAEFWWGKSPKSEIKKHKNYYPACTGKCQPILGHMLQGLAMDANPMLKEPEPHLKIETIFEDKTIAIINKPSGLLSVPSKSVNDSVASRVKRMFPMASGPLIVHRLDMPTSGLMVIAKTNEAYKNLQQQFIKRIIKKKYTAILEGIVTRDKGTIDLPHRVDIDNRPFQIVCHTHGKSSRTHFEVVSRVDNRTRIQFYPVTGRTHQLRVHSAHADGLNTPIVGDPLYGKKSDRMYLHAGYLSFNHPANNEKMEFEVLPEF